MIILITGDKGFIGSHLRDSLLSDGHIVLGFDHIDDYDALFNAMVKDKNKYKKIKKKKRKKLKENKKEYSKFLEEASEILNIKNTRWG